MKLKKSIAFILTIVLITALIPTAAFAADKPQDVFEADRIRLYFCNAVDYPGGLRDDFGLGWIDPGATVRFAEVDFGEKPFFAVTGAIAVSHTDIVNQGKTPVGGFEIYIDDEKNPSNRVAVLEDSTDSKDWGNYQPNATDLKGFTGKHKIIFRLTGKSQNILYLEFGRSSVDEPKEKYALNGLKMNGQNELQYSVNVTKFARDKGDASMVTMAVGLYSADGLLEKVQLKPVFDSDIVLTGEKSYATKEEVLTIDVTGMDAKTTVKAFLWDNLLSQKLLMPATVGKLSELTQL